MDRETIITYLQIIHTLAEFARERDLQFFAPKHLEDIAQWADVALALLKKQEAIPLQYSETREEYWHYESICPKCCNRWISMGEDHFCPCCGQAVKEGDPDA